MKKICFACLLSMVFKMFPQDLKGVYLHTKFNDQSGAYSMSVTLLTDAANNISRPSVQLFLGPNSAIPHTVNLPLVSTTAINSIDVNTYSSSVIYIPPTMWNITFTDSFWVSGIRNFSGVDPAKMKLFAYLGPPTSVADQGPEVTNLPLSISNFTIAGNQVMYNPFCQDADGDSLAYELVNYGVLENYYLPSNATINPLTGLFSFSKDSADQGLYTFSININEWRKINSTLRKVGLSQLTFAMTTNLTLGIKSYTSSHPLSLFPNPTNQTLSFKPDAINENGKIGVEINNALGEVVMQRTDVNLSQSLDVSGLKPGIYLIKIIDDAKTYSTKFVKVDN